MPAFKAIPGSPRVHESRVLSFPHDRVWELIRPLTLPWLKTVKETKVSSGKEAEVGSQRTVHYKDGTVQTLTVLELSDLEHFITYDVITSDPPVTVTSALHTIRVHPVTYDNTSLIEMISDYSNDVTQEVLQDSKYKKQELFADLLHALEHDTGKKHKVNHATGADHAVTPKKVKK